MSFTHVFADSASIYAVTADGSLLWYRDDLKDGTNGPNAQRGWAAASSSQIGFGWTGFKTVFAGDDGVIYAIRRTGELLWYRDLLRNGGNGARAQTGWAANSGQQIGGGWAGFKFVFSGGAGIIYAVRETGELIFYRDALRDGSNGAAGDHGWAGNSGKQIGVGWAGFRQVFSGGNGVIYAIKTTGELLWYRDERRDGSNAPDGSSGWAANSGSQIGIGWNFTDVFGPGDGQGLIYGITDSSDLLYYRDTLRDGTNGPDARRGWAVNSGAQIGLGWHVQPEQTIEGYAVPLSVRAGESVELKLSASAPVSGTIQLVRLLEQADGAVGSAVTAPAPIQLQHQAVPPDAWQNGCGWTTTTSLDIDEGLPSGLYSARITVGSDTVTDIVFVVRPAAAAARSQILVLVNTNCWNAYNSWGGRSNYTDANSGITLSFERPNPETTPDVRDGSGAYAANHLTAGEIWLLSWLEQQGFAADVCSDADMHAGTPALSAYKALVLSTHPEYWSQQMAAKVQQYLNSGGCLLYLGGNGAFRTVEYSADGSAMTTGADAPHWCAEAWQPTGPMPRTLLGVAYDVGADGNYPQRCGYIVDDASHRFMAGTGLANGDVFATSGRNGGGACGWEVDCASGDFEGGAPATGLKILAHGQLVTGAGYRGDLAYYDAAGGGFVLAVGSITVTGALPTDAALARLVKNALSEAVGR